MQTFSRFFACLAFVIFFSSHPFAYAESFDLDKDGKHYHCEEKPNNGNCWQRCPYSFSTCKSECGGGEDCWDKCPYSFSTCKSECGASSRCWDKCPYSFSTCKSECSGGKGCWDKCPYSFSTCKSECGAQAQESPLAELLFNAGRAQRIKADLERAQFRDER